MHVVKQKFNSGWGVYKLTIWKVEDWIMMIFGLSSLGAGQ